MDPLIKSPRRRSCRVNAVEAVHLETAARAIVPPAHNDRLALSPLWLSVIRDAGAAVCSQATHRRLDEEIRGDR
jgi:hypothetical protein